MPARPLASSRWQTWRRQNLHRSAWCPMARRRPRTRSRRSGRRVSNRQLGRSVPPCGLTLGTRCMSGGAVRNRCPVSLDPSAVGRPRRRASAGVGWGQAVTSRSWRALADATLRGVRIEALSRVARRAGRRWSGRLERHPGSGSGLMRGETGERPALGGLLTGKSVERSGPLELEPIQQLNDVGHRGHMLGLIRLGSERPYPGRSKQMNRIPARSVAPRSGHNSLDAGRPCMSTTGYPSGDPHSATCRRRPSARTSARSVRGMPLGRA